MQFEILRPRRRLTFKKLSPFFTVPIPAGEATPIEQEPDWIDIDEYLRDGRDDVVFVRASGVSMQSRDEAGIYDGDILAVTLTATAHNNDVVIALVNGEVTIKRLSRHRFKLYLVPANDAYATRRIEPTDDFRIWAVVKHIVRKMRRAA